MKRLTKNIADTEGRKNYMVDKTKVRQEENMYLGEAIDRLAGYENICESLETKQIEIAKELEQLKSEGKVKSAKFRQLMANKITNSNILSLFDITK